MTKLVKGFTCECGRYEKYPPYVYAHWNIMLNYTCDKCNAKYFVLRGKAIPLKGDKK